MQRSRSLVAVLALVLAGCSCSRTRRVEPAPAAATPTADAGEAVVAAAPADPEPPVDKAACRDLVNRLGGDPGDAQALVSDLARASGLKPDVVRDYVECRAVALDTVSTCWSLGAELEPDCRAVWAFYNQLRQGPVGKVWLFTDVDFERCQSEQEMKGACDALRNVARTGDISACPKGKHGPMCRAYFSLDASLLDAASGLDAAEKESIAKEIAEKKRYAAGLKPLVAEGNSYQRRMAGAALGDLKACQELGEMIYAICARVEREQPATVVDPGAAAEPAPSDKQPGKPKGRPRR